MSRVAVIPSDMWTSKAMEGLRPSEKRELLLAAYHTTKEVHALHPAFIEGDDALSACGIQFPVNKASALFWGFVSEYEDAEDAEAHGQARITCWACLKGPECLESEMPFETALYLVSNLVTAIRSVRATANRKGYDATISTKAAKKTMAELEHELGNFMVRV